jgi:uncharacterized protein DUF4388
MNLNRPRSAVPLVPEPAQGFHAELRGASLWDLVQIECLGRSRCVVEVSGEGGVGHLYFSGGRVVHAVTQHLSGQAAALEILGWTRGGFQPSERAWPAVTTIDTSHEALLLLAAKRRDEAAANLVVLELEENEEGDMAETKTQNGSRSATPVSVPRNDPLPDFAVMMRVGANGTIIKNKGGDEEFAGVVAYTQRLVELVGELLGLERFVAMECSFQVPDGQTLAPGQARCLLFTEANGDIVAIRPEPDSNIQPLRETLGL